MTIQYQGGLPTPLPTVYLDSGGYRFCASASPSPVDDQRLIVRVSQVHCDPSFAWHQVGDACITGLSWGQIADAVADAAQEIAKQLAETIREATKEKQMSTGSKTRRVADGWIRWSGGGLCMGGGCDEAPAYVSVPGMQKGYCEEHAEKRGVFAKEPATEVIDWARFVPTSVIDPRPASECRYRDGDIIACAASGHGGQVVASVRKVYRDGICADTLAGAGDWWASTQTRLIRHADGTWAPGYDANGPIAGKAECEAWCGLPYKDERVPSNLRVGGLPFGIADRDGTEQDDPAYCSAACLERAKEASAPVAPVKREPVAPWVRLKTPGKATRGEIPGVTHVGPWMCYRPPSDDADGSGCHGDAVYARAKYHGACEGCAEKLGVFGPVKDSDGPLAGRAVAQPNAGLPKNQGVTAGETASCDPCCVLAPFHGGKCCITSRSKARLELPPPWMLADDLLPPPPPATDYATATPSTGRPTTATAKPCPACNGIPFETKRCPRCGLASKAEPVRVRLAPVGATYPGLRQPVGVCVAGWSKQAGKDCGVAVARISKDGGVGYTCDVCHLEWEKYVASRNVPVQSVQPVQPPARIGTVPMSIGQGAGVGIWASRGMRR